MANGNYYHFSNSAFIHYLSSLEKEVQPLRFEVRDSRPRARLLVLNFISRAGEMLLVELDSATRTIGKLEMTAVRITNSNDSRSCFTKFNKPRLSRKSTDAAPSPTQVAADL